MSLTLSSVELDRMRSDSEALMPSTCSVLTRTETPDGQGGVTVTWATATAVPCRLAPMNLMARTDTAGDQFSIHEIYVLSVHWDRAIKSFDRIVYDSDTYQVMSVEDDHDWRVARRVTIAKVKKDD